jgi:hypothetical protein
VTWGTVTVGGITFREEIDGSFSGGTLKIHGQDSRPPQTLAAVIAAHDNIAAAAKQAAGDVLVVPVVFTDKANLTGFYRLTDGQSDLLRHASGAVQSATWQLTLLPLGTEREVEFESRLPSIARSTELTGQTPVFWHAPPPATGSYYTGTTVPSGSVVRQSAEGAVTVYTGIPAGVFPRWTCPADGFLAGSARLLFDGIRRIGLDSPALTVWELNNGLVQVLPGVTGALTVSAWSGSAWVSAKNYRLTVNGTAVTSTPELTVLRNDPEQVLLRLAYPVGSGRLTLDLGLRRGGRFVTAVMKRHSAASLGVTRVEAETATAVTGGLRASAADAAGDRFVMGSSKTTTATTATASLSKASVTQLDFFLGHEVGAAPAAGDAFADLLGQYLGGAGSDDTRCVRR